EFRHQVQVERRSKLLTTRTRSYLRWTSIAVFCDSVSPRSGTNTLVARAAPERRTSVRTQRLLASLTLVAMALAFRGSSAVTALGAQDGAAGGSSYVVVYAQGANAAEARAALAVVGATVIKENTAIGVATVESSGDLL